MSWVLTDDADRGTQLHAPRLLPEFIPFELNPTTEAEGHVAPPEGGCSCDHFHGSMFGEEDPAPRNCGWGCVEPFDDVSDSAQLLSAAFMRETRAYKKAFQTEPPDYAGAATDLTDALEDVIDAGKAVDADGRMNRQEKNKIGSDLRNARTADGVALKGIKRLRDGTAPNPAKTRKLARKKLVNALDAKQAAWKKLQRAGAVLRPS